MGIETLAALAIGSTVFGGLGGAATVAAGSGLALGGLAAGAAGSLLSAGGAVYGGMAANNAAQYRAKVADNFATQSRLMGEAEAQKQGMKTSALMGTQTAGQGASGLDLGSGSAVDVRATSAQLGRLDELTILNNAENKARAYDDQAMLERSSGKQSELEGWLKGSASVLGGVSGVSDKWMTYKTKGISPGFNI